MIAWVRTALDLLGVICLPVAGVWAVRVTLRQHWLLSTWTGVAFWIAFVESIDWTIRNWPG